MIRDKNNKLLSIKIIGPKVKIIIFLFKLMGHYPHKLTKLGVYLGLNKEHFG